MGKTNTLIKTSGFNLYLEIFCLMILISYWVYLNLVYQSLPDRIPIHFNSAGNADGFGNKGYLYELPRLATMFYVILTGINVFIYYFKNRLFFPVEASEHILRNTINTIRYFKFLIVIVFLAITLFLLQKI